MKKKKNRQTVRAPIAASPALQNNFSFYKIQKPVLGLLVFIFCLSLFKNISYPLIWNDESETIMMATRVLDFGYPKVHDGKNTVFMMPVNHMDSVKNFRVGYKKEYDAFIGNTWGMYYFGALGVLAAELTDDIYQKTFLLRFPFALIALLGLIIFCLAMGKFFRERTSYFNFIILFIIVELFSVSLVYHMREARYYSMTIFATAWLCYIYINHFFFNKYGKFKYSFMLIGVLFISYHINFITFAILCGFLVFHEALYFIYNVFIYRQSSFKNEFIRIFPTALGVLISGLIVYPFISFYDTINIAQRVSNDYNFTYNTYKGNLLFIYEFFKQQDFYYPWLILTVVFFFCLWRLFSSKKIWNQFPKSNPYFLKQVQVLILFYALFAVYALLIARSPYLFVRHFIVLQPIFTLIICLEIFLIGISFQHLLKPNKLSVYRIGFGILCIVIFFGNSSKKFHYLKEHIYQCTNQMKGVLDYQVPYILEKFKKPEELIIATNYEEFALMYYLKSKVVIGYIANEVEEAMKLTPDILIYRKTVGGNPEPFNQFLQKAKYNRVAFPVYDYPVNNIPEIEFMIPHLFRTKLTEKENEKADIFVKEQ